MADDREEFEKHKKLMSVALGRDEGAKSQATDLFVTLNKFDYPYLWSWMGLPIIQIPTEIVATQEVIWETRPDIIIETGVARGGSLIFMASILAATGSAGRVIGVDIDIRAHNREAIETHPLSNRIDLVQGGSTDAETLSAVSKLIPAGAKVMVVLDSDHSYSHVLAECRAYSKLVTNGCYLVVADTIVGHLPDGEVIERSRKWEKGDDPSTALREFLQEDGNFEVDEVINGKLLFSSSPGGYCKRVR